MTHPGLGNDSRAAILDWYASHRRALPFRESSEPWPVLVSEVIAQQTQAARAAERWVGFVAAYPTPADLATASPADVLRAWQGLGYNRRALNLWRAARQLVALHGGAVPADLPSLEALPGVGPYTARAVAAIAFGRAVGPVDTNVRRVLGRILAGDEVGLHGAALQVIADAAVPAGRAADWTHALMDLGALVCRPRRPACGDCPVRGACRYVGTAADPADETEEGAKRPGRRRGSQATPFSRTTRWLRGRILDRLRATEGDSWTVIAGPIGSHDEAAVLAALQALAGEGLVELDGGMAGQGRRARLPLA